VRGDCTEHAQLLADGAVALGLPARVVTGWVYREEDGFRGFVPHAWAEVDLGAPAGWVGVDPTLGQPIADASHVALGPAWEERPWEALAAAAEGRARVVEAR
jgi:transglutaminase-like putative cysteine protease